AEVVRTAFLRLDRTDPLSPPLQGSPTIVDRLEPLEFDPAASSVHSELSQRTIDVHPPSIAAQPGSPTAFGRYQVIGLLGKGGFGTVYLGYDNQLERRVAIKVPRQDRSRSATSNQQSLAEARRLARLKHPGIVTVYDAGEQDGLI